jgi:hypothetical protein
VVALSLWWCGNTVAHDAVHRRLFRSPACERAFGVWLTLCLGVPQSLWRQWHLAHHRERRWRPRVDAQLGGEVAALAGSWVLLLFCAPAGAAGTYLEGLLGGLALCWLHGYYEHRGGTTSVYGRVWNLVFFNDGYHAEHHAAPGRHWSELPRHRLPKAKHSRLPPVVRWLAVLQPAALLDLAERLVLGSPWLQRRVLAAHRRALFGLLAGEMAPRRVTVVGGGLFPRTALLLRELWPAAAITVLDQNEGHLEVARRWLGDAVRYECAVFVPGQELPADVVVLPLALRGRRRSIQTAPPAARVLVHDWLWRRPGQGRVVSWWLCKRVYVLEPSRVSAALLPT